MNSVGYVDNVDIEEDWMVDAGYGRKVIVTWQPISKMTGHRLDDGLKTSEQWDFSPPQLMKSMLSGFLAPHLQCGHGLILRWYPSTCLEGPSNTMKTLSQNSLSPSEDTNSDNFRIWSRSVNHSTTHLVSVWSQGIKCMKAYIYTSYLPSMHDD
jgi:hypothetical protein